MYSRVLCAAFIGAAVISVTPASAVTIFDTYVGGGNTWNPNTVNGDAKGDVIGTPYHFDIFKMEVSRIGGDLQVVVHTNYAANPNSTGTGFGALFLSAQPITPAGSAPYATDTFIADPGRFQYAFTMPYTPIFNGNIATGEGSLYALAGDGSDIQLSHDNFNTSGNNFRNGHAVDYKGTDDALDGHDGSTWTVNKLDETITFLIKNENGMLGTDFALAWAMSCANDVILGNVSLDCENCGPTPAPGETPIPGALALFGGGLGVLGLLGHRARRRNSRLADRV